MRARALRDDAGMAMLETVIVLPIVLMLLFAVIEFGIVFGRWQVLSNAAREGARRAVVFRPPATCTAGAVKAEVDAAVANYASTLGMNVSSGDVALSGACVPGSSTVTVTHTYDFLFLDRFAPSLTSSLRLVGSSTMRNE